MLPLEAGSADALLSIGGCSGDACTDEPARAHVTLETWYSELFRERVRAQLGSKMPKDLGTTGNDGFVGVWISEATLAHASNVGVNLEHYTSYNASWHNPSRFFDRFTDMSTDGMLPCSASKFDRPKHIDEYVRITGDFEGTEVVDGVRVAKCVGGAAGVWWLAPACRRGPETCVPMLDSGDGWFLDAWMQRAHAYNMPWAIAVATWEKQVGLPRIHRVLFQWWKPDTTFLELSPVKLVFPQRNEEQWENGVQIAKFQPTDCRKWGHPELLAEEVRLKHGLQKLSVTSRQMDEMLAAAVHATESQVACAWLRAHPDMWAAWAPKETDCFEGWGLADSSGAFIDSVSEAVLCRRCGSGRYSKPLVVGGADETRVCAPCGPGLFQPYMGQARCMPCHGGTYEDGVGSTACRACASGTVSEQNGSLSCTTCGLGSVQPLAGRTGCEHCLGGTFQDSEGATACSLCPTGQFSEEAASACQPCALGRVADESRSTACRACGPGYFAASIGQSRCSACPVATFANTSGSSACERCGGGAPSWTTVRWLETGPEKAWVRTDAAKSEEACSCAVGARLEQGRCVPCAEGLACPGRGAPLILPGYYSGVDLSVFKCRGKDQCPGDLPGGTCASGREGVACARCPAGTKPAGDGICAPFEWWGWIPLPGVALCTPLACLGLYRAFDRPTSLSQSALVSLAGAAGALLVTFLQYLSVVWRLDVAIRQLVRGFLDLSQVFAFDVNEVLMVSCVADATPSLIFGLALFMTFGTAFMLFATHVVAVSMNHKSRFRERQATVLSAASASLMTLFTPLAALGAMPFICRVNPNGKWTMEAHEDIVCWSGEEDRHGGLLVLGFVSLACPVGSSLSLHWSCASSRGRCAQWTRSFFGATASCFCGCALRPIGICS